MDTGREPNSDGNSEYERLREAYDRAFRQLSTALATKAGVTAAEQEYHERRDALSKFIMSTTRGHVHESSVQRLAYILWEKAGRPPGTAEFDWHNAEALLATK